METGRDIHSWQWWQNLSHKPCEPTMPQQSQWWQQLTEHRPTDHSIPRKLQPECS